MVTNNIVLVEDDSRFRVAFSELIEEESHLTCVYQCKNSREAMSLSEVEPIDLFILDIKLPDMDGVSLLKDLKRKFSKAKFLMCTVFEDSFIIIKSLKLGADGYILKSDSPQKMLESINIVLNGESPLSMGVSAKIIKYLNGSAKKPNQIDVLTDKEQEVLELLSRGLLYKEIADIQKVALITIKKHCSNIYSKLNVTNKTEALNIYYNI